MKTGLLDDNMCSALYLIEQKAYRRQSIQSIHCAAKHKSVTKAVRSQAALTCALSINRICGSLNKPDLHLSMPLSPDLYSHGKQKLEKTASLNLLSMKPSSPPLVYNH